MNPGASQGSHVTSQVHKSLRPREWQIQEETTAEEEAMAPDHDQLNFNDAGRMDLLQSYLVGCELLMTCWV